MRFLSAADTRVELRSRRFRFRSFLVRIWLLPARMRLSFPVLVLLTLLAAPRCVFIFGMIFTHVWINDGFKYTTGRRPCRVAWPRRRAIS